MDRNTRNDPARPQAVVIEDGGVASPRGFRAAGIHAGFKKRQGQLDFALVVSDRACPSAGVFTKNVFCAAPVRVSRGHLGGVSYGRSRAVMVNAGNANASTGPSGLQVASASAALAASAIGCSAEEVLVASTGVIGSPLPLDLFEKAIPRAVQEASEEGSHDAACAIMTTDTVPKKCALSYPCSDPALGGAVFTIGGMAKGSGMIMPDMATMIAVLTTDAPLAPPAAYAALKAAADLSFNKVTVDSDTSTNDSCFLLANGMAPGLAADAPLIEEGSAAFEEFVAVLTRACTSLARSIAADGEGATKLVTVTVAGAADERDADLAARAIANSPLVKTAVFGHDANWGRIAMAAGKSGAAFEQESVSIDIMGMKVCRKGTAVAFDEEEALRRFEAPEITIDVDLGAGNAATTMWTCDYSHDYITINGDYRT